MADLDLFAGVPDIARVPPAMVTLTTLCKGTSGIFRIQLCLGQVRASVGTVPSAFGEIRDDKSLDMYGKTWIQVEKRREPGMFSHSLQATPPPVRLYVRRCTSSARLNSSALPPAPFSPLTRRVRPCTQHPMRAPTPRWPCPRPHQPPCQGSRHPCHPRHRSRHPLRYPSLANV